MSDYAYNYIKAAMRLIGSLASGETPTADEYTDCLSALNGMLNSWSGNNINLHKVTIDTLTLTGANSYTIGTGATLNTARPAAILGAYLDSKDNPYKLLTEAEYRDDKYGLWYNPDYSTGFGMIYINPADTGTLYLHSLKPFTNFAVYTDYLYVPPEYDDAIKYNLAIRISPEFGKPIQQDLLYMAKETLNTVQTRNFAEKINTVKPEVISLAGYRYDINWDI